MSAFFKTSTEQDGKAASERDPYGRDVRAQPHSATARLRFELSPGTHSLQQPLDFSGLGPVELHGHSAASTVLSAGTELNASNFVDLGNGIFELHLRAAGLTDYGTLISGGLKDCQNNKTELFVNNQRLWLARWPNVAANGTWQWGRIANVTDAQTFVPEASAPLTALAQDPDLWLHGYWVYDWSDEFVAVANVSTRNGTIAMTTSTATPQVGGRWMAINAQSQLDAPGEYYIDRASGRLTVMFPPGVHPSNQDFSAVLSTLPHAIFTPNATALHLHDLTVAYARGSGIVLPDARGALLERLVVANHGGNGTQVHGVNNQVRNSDFFNLACMGLSVTGGNRTSLVPSNNVVDGNHIHDYALWKRTYQGGLFWAGVGNSYLNNVIENGPHNGILGGGNEADHLGGNNCIFVNNTLRHLAFETTDTGAFYSCGQDGQAWINRGNVIANCTFIDVRMHEPTALGYSSVQAGRDSSRRAYCLPLELHRPSISTIR
ncbi:uncharacterized protein MONBRDRAFT_25137 [Monosiga brevicollis MX1]|uniref:Right handed beta helix domain-containing protein n=1 Tax=Monosiga brevicollis TaxID=81824 RepID=A9UYI6_MONBE|nr:uncharacterized protein MONBRDRAFT_25137 [Monosiga brevicollis MX1]EDQ89613.1 predicted protein [Monosiga brevicollis MX1]|eukprot:XP_001745642.1 hypothetical protein [Monosiga brevicollis MX1]